MRQREMTSRFGGRGLRAFLASATLAATVSACNDEIPATAPIRALDRGLPPASSAIPSENGGVGTRDWYSPPTAWSADSDLAIWASPYSVRAGDTLRVFAHARYGPLSIRLYRLGYYGGAGGRLVFSRDSVAASPQPACEASSAGVTRCPWASTLALQVDPAARSGIYLVKATDARGKTWSYPLVVRDGRRAAVLAIVPQFTWQAYNAFGGTSLYTRDAAGRLGTSVSFERPYKVRGGGGYAYGLGYSNDLAVSRWLERRGIDVTYVSDGDLTSDAPAIPQPYRAAVIVGHAEYWTWNEYTYVQKLRDAGVHLMFMSANNAYWNVRTAPGDVTGAHDDVVYCYKEQLDPWGGARQYYTGLFRSWTLNRPENGLYGVMHFMHGYGTFPLIVSDSGMGDHAADFLAAAGLSPGDTLPGLLTLGAGATTFMSIEGDRLDANGYTPRGIEVLFHADIKASDGSIQRFHTTFFVASSGAGVFASGFNEWGRWLDDWFQPGDARIRNTSDAVMDWMLSH